MQFILIYKIILQLLHSLKILFKKNTKVYKQLGKEIALGVAPMKRYGQGAEKT